ncbi:MAG: peroxiredoxin family protein [Verrucomicrobiaceae bacterium]|nr:peroxiredoxin family protein [Verrucomicrobiaceae bacterium]
MYTFNAHHPLHHGCVDGSIKVMAHTGKTAVLFTFAFVIASTMYSTHRAEAQLPSPLARFGNLPCLAPIIRGINREAPRNIGEALLLPPYDPPEDNLKVGVASFPITTSNPKAQEVFNHGISLLHLFWTIEAERSFRHAASLDPESPMPYWAMALANERFPGRAAVYINYANHLAGKNPQVTPIEHAWIQTYRRYFSPEPGEPESGTPESRQQRNLELEDMAYAFPGSFETRAFLLRELILDDFRTGIPITGKFTTDALATQLAQQKPNHPSRHYRLWLWSRDRPLRVAEDALSSPLVSPSAPTAWRFSANALARAGLFHDSLHAGENALRLAHRRMHERFTMPHDAQNYTSDIAAHINSMIACGMINVAQETAKKLISLPRPSISPPPKTDTGRKAEDTFLIGRQSLAKTLIRSEQWDKLLGECTSLQGSLHATNGWIERSQTLYWQAIANLNLGKINQARQITQDMESLFRTFLSSGSGVNTEQQITRILKNLRTYSAFFEGDRTTRPKGKLLNIGNYHLARLAQQKGSHELAMALARQDLLDRPGQPDATANFCSIAFAADIGNSRNEALLAFDSRFRRNASLADRDNTLFHKELKPVINHLKLRGNWTLPRSNPKAALPLPDPEKLGPLDWSPPSAPAWSLPSANKETLSLEKLQGNPVVLIFFVGIGCPYCVDQLKTFTPHAQAYANKGIDIITISSDEEKILTERLAGDPDNVDKGPKFPFPILSDPSLKTFKAYHCFDSLDGKAMHGVFLISPHGKLLWSNVSHEPFLQPEFLLREASRLLAGRESALKSIPPE